jgi:hypothetical protein
MEVRDGLSPELARAWADLLGYEVARPHRGRLGRGKDAS